MIIKSLELDRYRNYDTLQISLDQGINIFYGDNAQGKTNALEAFYLCCTSKSHKGSKDREIIQFDREESHIKLYVEKDGVEYRIDMHLKKNKSKGIAINGMPIKRASELFGIVNVIFFSPEDLNIIKNGPSERRRFIDLELCQLDKIYTSDLMNYNKIILQRNKLLKDLSYKPETLDTLQVWDMQLVHFGRKVIRARETFIGRLNEIITGIHSKLTGGKENLTLHYEPNVAAEALERELLRGRERDIRQKMSLTGPHRDDISFLADGIDIRRFGSQGQQRTAALSLKLSEIELVKLLVKDNPVLLLDDVLSELDSGRQTCLLDSISDIQTLITCTGLDDFVNHRFHIDKIFKVTEGRIFSEN